jgi:hypothetical protein
VADVEQRLHLYARLQATLASIIVGFSLMALLLSLYLYMENNDQQRELEAVAVETHGALCALKEYLETRVENTENILAKHSGALSGVQRDIIVTTLDDQKSTLAALRVVNC